MSNFSVQYIDNPVYACTYESEDFPATHSHDFRSSLKSQLYFRKIMVELSSPYTLFPVLFGLSCTHFGGIIIKRKGYILDFPSNP